MAPAAPVDPVAALGDPRRGIANLRTHAARGMLVSGAFQVTLLLVSALRGLAVAAFLTRADYGVWGIVGLSLWTTLGFKAVFGATDKYVQQSEDDQEEAFQRAFTVEVIYAAALIPLTAAVVLVFAVLTGASAVVGPGLCLILLLPAAALQFPIATFLRRLDYGRQRSLQAIEPIVGAVVMVGMAIAGAGYWSFVGGALAGAWLTAVVAVIASPFRLRLRFDLVTLRRYFGFSLPLFIAAGSELALFYVIILLGSGPLGIAGIGAFTLAGNLVQFTDQADAVVTETLYPAVCAVADRVALLREIFVKSNRLSLMWAVPFGVGLAVFGSDLIQFVLGPRWLPALPLLQILGVVTAVNHVGYNWSAFTKARGSTWPIAWSGVAVAAVTIGFAIPLMYSDHLVGLGIAFAAGQAFSLVLRSVVIARVLDGARIVLQLGRAFAPTLCALPPVLVVRALLGRESTLAGSLAVLLVYALATVTATAVLERSLLREAIGYLLKRRDPKKLVPAAA